jgi:endonuclease/exonuclease/phosphatase family metal-dependent hydrolase
MAEETGLETVMRDLRRADRIFEADVFLLQEVLHSGRQQDSFPLQLARRLRFHAAFAPGDALAGGFARGVAVLSRFRIRDPQLQRLQHFDLNFKQRCRVALGVTIDSPMGPVRVVNTHLDSRLNTGERLKQLKPVVDHLSPGSEPQLIGGDFNTANVLWLRRWLPVPFVALQSRTVRDFMESHGFATPFTSTGRTFSYLPLKLDWVFVKGLQAVDAGVAPIGFSDHRGLWVKFHRPTADTAQGK